MRLLSYARQGYKSYCLLRRQCQFRLSRVLSIRCEYWPLDDFGGAAVGNRLKFLFTVAAIAVSLPAGLRLVVWGSCPSFLILANRWVGQDMDSLEPPGARVGGTL